MGEERERSHRLWQRSARGATWARWWERGRVAQGAAPSTGRSRGEEEEAEVKEGEERKPHWTDLEAAWWFTDKDKPRRRLSAPTFDLLAF